MPTITLEDYTVQASRETAEALFGRMPGDGPYVTLGLFRFGVLADPRAKAEEAAAKLNEMHERLAPALDLPPVWVWSGAEILRERAERLGGAGGRIGVEGPS